MLARAVLVFCLFAFAASSSVVQAQPQLQPPSTTRGPSGPTPAPASGGLIQRITPDALAAIMQKANYSNVSVKENRGTRFVESQANGVRVIGGMSGCEGGACSIVVFRCWFGAQPTIDAKYINAWNTSWVLPRLYRDGDGDLTFDLAVPLLTGVTPDYLESISILYANLITKLMEFKPGQ